MRISFIIPYYKTEKYIDDLLNSLTKLELEDFEVVIIDDASEDGIKSKISLYPTLNIRLISLRKNVGLGFARNHGLENVSDTTTHIIYLDSDDRISDSFKFEEQYDNDTVYLYGINKFNKKKITHLPHNYREWFESEEGIKTNSYIWGIVIPVQIAKKYKFLRRAYEDLEVKAEIMANEKIVSLNASMVDYRLRRRSLTTTANSSKDRIEAYAYILNNNLTCNESFFKVRSFETYFLMNRSSRKEVKHILPKLSLWRVSIAALAIFFQKITLFKLWYNGFNLYD